METCKICKQQVPTQLMFCHKQECLPDPNDPIANQSNLNNQQIQPMKSEIQMKQSDIPYSEVLSQSQNKVQIQPLIKNPQPINIKLPSNINNQQPINNLEQQMTQSTINRYQAPCDYCQLDYPVETMQDHVDSCEARLMLMNFQEEQYQESIVPPPPMPMPIQRPRVPLPRFRPNEPQMYEGEQSDDSYEEPSEIHQHRQQQMIIQRNGNQQFVLRSEQLLPDGNIQIIERNSNPMFDLLSQLHSNQRNLHRQPPQVNQAPNRLLSFSALLNNLLGSLQNEGMSAEDLGNLNSMKYIPLPNLSEEHKQCSICITDYEPEEELILLPCTHRYHHECIGSWLKKNSNCPICKFKIRGNNQNDQDYD